MLGALGIPAFNWLGNPDGAFFVIVLLRVWQFGSPMVIFLGGPERGAGRSLRGSGH